MSLMMVATMPAAAQEIEVEGEMPVLHSLRTVNVPE
ncbi:MAG: hypothetical protein RL015_3164, partial [Verrucomicrobiota bacterium]